MADAQAMLPMRIPRRKQTPGERFRDFHKDHPEVFESFVAYARRAKRGGWGAFPAGIVARRVEWHLAVECDGGRPAILRIRPAYVPRYARLAMKECGDLAGFFRTRKLRLEGK